MKIIKYGPGMKLRKGYLTECGCCHTTFIATPNDVEFLWRNDEPVEFPTPTYRTYCPVCGDSRIYQVRDEVKKKKKRRKPKVSVLVLFSIMTLLDVIALITVPFAFEDDNITVSRVIIISILTVSFVSHLFTAAFSADIEKDKEDI